MTMHRGLKASRMAGRVLSQLVAEPFALGVAGAGPLQSTHARRTRRQAVTPPLACDGLERLLDLGHVPLSRRGLLTGLGLAPDEDQPVAPSQRAAVDAAHQQLGHLERLVRIAPGGRTAGLTRGPVSDRPQLVPPPETLLELG